MLTAIRMSGPVFDWIAEVMRACTPSPLMVSTSSLMPSAFWAFVGDLAAQQLVGNRHEVDEFEPMQGRPLRVSRRPAGGENSGETAGPRGHRTRAGKPQKAAATSMLHHFLSIRMFYLDAFARLNHNYRSDRSGVL